MSNMVEIRLFKVFVSMVLIFGVNAVKEEVKSSNSVFVSNQFSIVGVIRCIFV